MSKTTNRFLKAANLSYGGDGGVEGPKSYEEPQPVDPPNPPDPPKPEKVKLPFDDLVDNQTTKGTS